MTFPNAPFVQAQDYLDAYAEQLTAAARSVDRGAFAAAAALVGETITRGATIHAAGNGGSAAIANHLVCDCVKSVQTLTALKPRVYSLSANIPFITAIANDIGYEDVFRYQLNSVARSGDLLVTISSSGDSENIVRAIAWAKENGVASIAMTGFAGGRSRLMADIALHVDADNYGIIEDVHQTLMHSIAQYVRLSAMTAADISTAKF